ncbi:MAG: radical SAM protein [Bdellovibrionales bacterium]|nr:radical SAM protein [Bdellovibrionales bacterium]
MVVVKDIKPFAARSSQNHSSTQNELKQPCTRKWTDIKISVWDGVASVCGLAKPIQLNELVDPHNSPEVMRDRLRMLSGCWPALGRGCEGCQRQEQLGIKSERQRSDESVARPNKGSHIDKHHFDSLSAEPENLKLMFRNKCNMKCVYCSSSRSSSWQIENSLYAPENSLVNFDTDSLNVRDEKYQRHLAFTWRWLKKHSQSLKSLHISGGEPFLQSEVWHLVEYLTENPHPELKVTIVSNLQIESKSFQAGLRRLRKLREVVAGLQLICSIDSWGEPSEYIRFGHEVSQFENNFQQVLSLSEKIDVSISTTLTALNVSHLPVLTDQVYRWLHKRQFDWSFKRCKSPARLDPAVLPVEISEQPMLQTLAECERLFGGRACINEQRELFLEILNEPENPRLLFALTEYLNELDTKRSTNWQEMFPFLAGLITPIKAS